MPLTRTTSILEPELDHLVSQTIGACIAVHRGLGPGLSEVIYSKALVLELNWVGLGVEVEKAVPVRYRGEVLCHQRVDLLVEQRVVVEVKSVEALHPVHVAQAAGYLRLTNLKVALLVNFNVAVLKQGLRRIVR